MAADLSVSMLMSEVSFCSQYELLFNSISVNERCRLLYTCFLVDSFILLYVGSLSEISSHQVPYM